MILRKKTADAKRKGGTVRAVSQSSTGKDSIDKLAIIIVTYRRQELLSLLFDSIATLNQMPWRVVVVDNENSDETRRMAEELDEKLLRQSGSNSTVTDDTGNSNYVVYAPQEKNLGGSGGFSRGVELAYAMGAEWFWIMDDDVMVLPDAIEKLSRWTDRHEVIQGSRYDYDGGPFYWQYQFLVSLGIPNPIAPSSFGLAGYRVMNTLCFEGGLIKRSVVEKIGVPDPRFFIYWDDTIYGYCASKVTNPIVVSDVILRRTREIGNWSIGTLRQLNSTSDTNRYYIMRNRGYMARYFMVYGDYRPFLFSLGTLATMIKEIIRLLTVDRDHIRSGFVQLVRGWWDSHKLFHDPEWKPMPPLSRSCS